MYFGCDVDMCNYVIKDVGLQNVHGINGWKTWTGSIPIYFKRGDDYYTSSIDVVRHTDFSNRQVSVFRFLYTSHSYKAHRRP